MGEAVTSWERWRRRYDTTHNHGKLCEWFPRHLPQVTVSHRLRDGYGARFWIRCYECDFVLGPFARGEQARAAQRVLEATPVNYPPYQGATVDP